MLLVPAIVFSESQARTDSEKIRVDGSKPLAQKEPLNFLLAESADLWV